MKIKTVVAGLLVLTISACTSTRSNYGVVETEYGLSGEKVRTVETINSKVHAQERTKLAAITQADQTRSECFDALGAMPQSEAAQVAREMRIALSGVDCGASGNDVLIAETNASVQRQANWIGLGRTALQIGLGVVGVNALNDLGQAALAGAGGNTTINADNGSNVDGILTGNNSSQSNEIGGVPLEDGNLATVALGTPPPVAAEGSTPTMLECLSLRELIPVAAGSPDDVNGGTDTNGDGLVCSNSDGTSFDNT